MNKEPRPSVWRSCFKSVKPMGIPIEDVVALAYQTAADKKLRMVIDTLLANCSGRQLEVMKKFISDIAMALGANPFPTGNIF